MRVQRCLLIWSVIWQTAVLVAEETGLRAPPDFNVTLYADDTLAHDIYSMTIDSNGRVVVAGAGYVKTLHDDDADGRADRATLFSKLPASGAHGMCFDGPDLICTGDNSLMRLSDTNQDGVADGDPQVLANLRHPEHGANGVVQGPDGWFYVICGNDAGISEEHITTNRSPVTHPQCGAVLRVSPDGQKSEIVAHGFRNPYDLAFAADGTMFTVDADGERDQHLPWYTPTRLFDIAPGMHHGWMLKGWQKSWNRPSWFPDNVPRVCEIGRGSPTGVIVYRHRQFPSRYRNNVFSCCWTMGRVYHFPLERNGTSYRAKHEIFLETTDDVGFAPVDLAVGPRGDVFVAIGGRRTRGSVFRIRYKDGSLSERDASLKGARSPEDKLLDQVLAADEPLSAWSRARWVPLAKKVGSEPLLQAAFSGWRPIEQQIRAIEILTELFDGVPTPPMGLLPGGPMPGGSHPLPKTKVPPQFELPARELLPEQITARLAWSHSRLASTAERRASVLQLAGSIVKNGTENLATQRAAWEGLATYLTRESPRPAIPPYPPRMPTPFLARESGDDHFIQFARYLADARSDPDTPEPPASDRPRVVLDWLWRLQFRGKLGPEHARRLADVFRRASSTREYMEAIRLIEIAFGDIEMSDADPQVLPGYALRGDLTSHQELIQEIGRTLVSAFPDEDREVNLELARLCGMLGLRAPKLPERIMRQCTAESPVVDDLHYLLVLALLDTPRDEVTTKLSADALLGLASKMQSRQQFPSRNWPLRVGEMFERLCHRDPGLAATTSQHLKFGHPDHALFVKHMPEADRPEAARNLLAAVHKSNIEWTPEIVSVTAFLPAEESFPQLREEFDNIAVRDAIIQNLAESPQLVDRELFVTALASPQADIVEHATGALTKLRIEPSDEEWIAVVNALRRYVSAPQNESLRLALAELMKQWSPDDVPDHPIKTKDPREAYQPHFDWFATKHAELAKRLSNWSDDIAAWRERLSKVNWEQGNTERGRFVFEKRSCHRCHAGTGPLGPDLAGVASRLSRDDLFAHIVDPNKEVSPLYQTTQIVTGRGRIVVGLIVYESPESTLVQTSPDVTVRIAGEEIKSMAKSNQSLMPVGLLNDVSPEELADLYAYLQTLRK